MTSAASLPKPKNVLQHSIGISIRRLFPAVIGSFLIISFFSALNILTLLLTKNVQQQYRYLFVTIEPTFSAIVILSAILFAYILFSFACNSKEYNTMVILGITRKKLFFVRYLTGLLSLMAVICIPLIAMLAANLSQLPDTSLILQAFWHHIAGYCCTAFLIYNITVFIITLSGTFFESLLYNLVALLTPALLFLGAEPILGQFFGSSFNSGYSPYGHAASLYDQMAQFDPLRMFSSTAVGYASKSASLPVYEANYQTLALWALVALVLFCAALLLFLRRRAETVGKAGGNRIIGSIASGILAFAVSSFVFQIATLSLAIQITLMIAIFVVVFALCALFINRGFHQIGQYVKGLSVTLAIMIIFVGICLTGGLGYSGYLPPEDQVESITMSYLGSPSLSTLNETWGGSTIIGYNYQNTDGLTLTEPEDISLARKLHETIIDSGPLTVKEIQTPMEDTPVSILISIRYTLKDGSQVTRIYQSAKLGDLQETLAFDGTGEYASRIEDALQQIDQQLQTSPDAAIVLTDANGVERTSLDLSSEELLQLFDALEKDLLQETVEQRYFPAEKPLGILDFSFYQDSALYNYGDGFSSKAFYIGSHYTNTITFLEQHDFMQYLKCDKEVVSIRLCEYLPIDTEYPNWSVHPYFQMSTFESNLSTISNYSTLPTTKVEAAQHDAVLAALRTNYYTSEGGYLAEIRFKGEDSYLYQFLPQSEYDRLFS